MAAAIHHGAVLVWSAIALAVALIAYVKHLATGPQRLERVSQALLSGASPSTKVRQLARQRGGRIEAMNVYRRETGMDGRRALAMVRTLQSSDR